MIVPASTLPSGIASPLANDNQQQAQPSQAQLLMAAAEMHKMGRLGSRKETAPSVARKGKPL